MRVNRIRLLLIGLGAIICAVVLPIPLFSADGDIFYHRHGGRECHATSTYHGLEGGQDKHFSELPETACSPSSSSSSSSSRSSKPKPTPTPTPLPTSVQLGGQTLYRDSYIRDAHRGQTYRLAFRSDLGIVRQWIAPTDPAIYVIDWADVLAHKTFPTAEIAAIPLDERHPPAGMLVRDSASGRIVHYDPAVQQWRHVPDIPTFQALGLRWCDVTVADPDFLSRINEGMAHPPTPADQ